MGGLDDLILVELVVSGRTEDHLVHTAPQLRQKAHPEITIFQVQTFVGVWSRGGVGGEIGVAVKSPIGESI